MTDAGPVEPGSWEQRWHPLREEWVIVAGHRQQRPWTGKTVAAAAADAPGLRSRLLPVPGQRRVSGASSTRATRPRSCSTTTTRASARTRRATVAVPPPPYRASPAVGVARVVCFSPRHDLTLAEMPSPAIADVVDVWRDQTRELGARPEVRQVLCFENKGDVVGVSNPHPHGQIYATSFVWKTIRHRARRVASATSARPGAD